MHIVQLTKDGESFAVYDGSRKVFPMDRLGASLTDCINYRNGD